MGYGRWEATWAGLMITALLVETLNAFYLNLWSYNILWSALSFLPFSNFGMFGFIGWTILWGFNFSFTYNLSRKSFVHPILIWLLSWFLMGLFAEIINSKLVNMWTYFGIFALYPMPLLDFSSLFFIGWIAIGLISYVIIYVINSFFS